MQIYDEKTKAEIRWKIATDFVNYIPHVFDEEFRKISAGRCDAKIKEAELKIYKEAAKMERKYALALNFPLDTALDIANAHEFISNAIFGSDMKGEVTEEKNDSARITTKSCPMLNLSINKGTDIRIPSELCSVFTKAAVESLNPAYKLIFQKSLCNRDQVCEVLIIKK
jgi:hypothetical protein